MTKNAAPEGVGTHELAFEVFGARARVAVPTAELLPQVMEQLPAHWTPCEARPGDRRFALELAGDGGYSVLQDDMVEARIPTLENALANLRYRLFDYAVHHARDHLIVSAGVVGHEGGAIVLPGPTRAGKTYLVAALLRAGAEYYADDWAILDAQGRVNPYPTPLFRLRGQTTPDDLIASARQNPPIPVGVIARVAYSPDASWTPQPRPRAEGVTMLIGHAYGMDDPPAALKIARSAARRALVIVAKRGEADEAAASLLEIAAQAPVGGLA